MGLHFLVRIAKWRQWRNKGRLVKGVVPMARTAGIGLQDFEEIRIKDNFYVDKTGFIKEWWEANDSVTLIARPRRFGKTLAISMVEKLIGTS